MIVLPGDWVSWLPKVELHCHLDLVMDPAMLRALQQRGHPLLVSPEMVEAAYPVQSYDDFWKWGEIVRPFEGDLGRFKPLLAVHMERLRAQHVIYTEIMLGTSELPRDRGELLDKLGDFREFANSLECGTTQVEFTVALNRQKPPEFLAEAAERILLAHEAGLIVGVGLAGPEQGYPVAPFRPIFERLHEAGVGIEIHAGEWSGPESVWDALEHGIPDRIGHGVAVFDDPDLVRAVQERRVHLEFCPTSNIKTGALTRIEDHPLRRALDLGLNFSINSDDPGPFECSVASEYRLAAEVFGFDEGDLSRVTANALGARFQPRLRYPEAAAMLAFVANDVE